MAGPVKTLFQALQASTFLAGVNLAFGEESVPDESIAPPKVCLAPTSGVYEAPPGNARNLDPAVEAIWSIDSAIDLYLHAWAAGDAPIDNCEAVENLRVQVLSAMQDQRAQYADTASVAYGLAFRPVSERWLTMSGGAVRYGRVLVITVVAEVAVGMAVPPEATVTQVITSTSITAGPT